MPPTCRGDLSGGGPCNPRAEIEPWVLPTGLGGLSGEGPCNPRAEIEPWVPPTGLGGLSDVGPCNPRAEIEPWAPPTCPGGPSGGGVCDPRADRSLDGRRRAKTASFALATPENLRPKCESRGICTCLRIPTGHEEVSARSKKPTTNPEIAAMAIQPESKMRY